MIDKPSSSLEEFTGEKIEWRSMSQEEMEQRWKELAEKMKEQALDKYKVEDNKRGAYRGQRFFFGKCAKKKTEEKNTKVERRLLAKNLRFVQRIHSAASAQRA